MDRPMRTPPVPPMEPYTASPILARICSSVKLCTYQGDTDSMAYVIAEPCIGTKDTACVDACPVDCIHPKKDSPAHAEEEMLYIDPVECIDCGACVPRSEER